MRWYITVMRHRSKLLLNCSYKDEKWRTTWQQHSIFPEDWFQRWGLKENQGQLSPAPPQGKEWKSRWLHTIQFDILRCLPLVCVHLGKEKNKGKEKPTMFGSVYLKKKKVIWLYLNRLKLQFPRRPLGQTVVLMRMQLQAYLTAHS